VIVIIGILAVALIPRLTWVQGMARDKARIADIKQIQTALEFYASENNGRYPISTGWLSNWRWLCWWYNIGYESSGPNWWIPNLAPDYMSSLPSDPKPTTIWGPGWHWCYIYKSDGIDYIVWAFRSVEWVVPNDFKRPGRPTQKTFVVYSSWARMW